MSEQQNTQEDFLPVYTKGFDNLIEALAYVNRKGDMPHIVQEHWDAFDYRKAPGDCDRCKGSGEDPEGYYDQFRGDAGYTYDGPCRNCQGTGEVSDSVILPVKWKDAMGMLQDWLIGQSGPLVGCGFSQEEATKLTNAAYLITQMIEGRNRDDRDVRVGKLMYENNHSRRK